MVQSRQALGQGHMLRRGEVPRLGLGRTARGGRQHRDTAAIRSHHGLPVSPSVGTALPRGDMALPPSGYQISLQVLTPAFLPVKFVCERAHACAHACTITWRFLHSLYLDALVCDKHVHPESHKSESVAEVSVSVPDPVVMPISSLPWGK